MSRIVEFTTAGGPNVLQIRLRATPVALSNNDTP